MRTSEIHTVFDILFTRHELNMLSVTYSQPNKNKENKIFVDTKKMSLFTNHLSQVNGSMQSLGHWHSTSLIH